MKKAVLILIALCLLGVGFLLFYQPTARHPDYYLSRTLGMPLPQTLQHVKTLSLVVPTFGEGHCIAAYSIHPKSFELFLQALDWKPGPIDGSLEPSPKFASVWPGPVPELETYHVTIGEWRWVQMVVSKDHTKILFSLMF
jgi:hypothetical protein